MTAVAWTWLGYALFVVLGVLSRVWPALLVVMAFVGIVAPAILVRRERPRRVLGYTRADLGRSLAWAAGIGAVMSMLTVLLVGVRPQPLPGVQLVVGLVLWMAVLSPAQENVFRGWMQPRLQAVWGPRAGLITTAVAFALWHLAPPLTGTSTTAFAVTAPSGLLMALVLGLLTGLARQRTDSMVGPWLGHAFAGLALVMTGQMTVVQYTPGRRSRRTSSRLPLSRALRHLRCAW